eukprot:5969011-Alexandrium_andersonii.AAC.1
MSASLVGSEMCIRDRIGRPLGRHPMYGDERTHLSWARIIAPKHCTTQDCCLLYTSDAADDM